MKDTLNLLPRAEKARPPRQRLLLALAVALGAYVLLILGLWGSEVLGARKLQAELRALKAERARLQGALQAAQARRRPPAVPVEAKIAQALRETPPWDALLAELSLLVPQEVWLLKLQGRAQKEGYVLRLKGQARTAQALALFIQRLEGSAFMEDVQVLYIQKADSLTAFQLQARLRWS
jgi:Tfp pilus assembly protein PilN